MIGLDPSAVSSAGEFSTSLELVIGCTLGPSLRSLQQKIQESVGACGRTTAGLGVADAVQWHVRAAGCA